MDPVEAYRLLIADVYELAGLSRRISEADAAAHGSTAARWHLLSVVSEAPLTVSAAARRLGLPRQAVQRVADDLVACGHAAKRPNPGHARAPLIEPTDEGRAVLDALWRRSDAARRAALDAAGLDPADLLAARAVLRRLATALRQP